MNESEATRELCKFWEAQGGLTIVLAGNLFSGRGWPDRIFLREGKIMFVEFKLPSGKISDAQESRIKQLRMHGAIVGVYVHEVRRYSESAGVYHRRNYKEFKKWCITNCSE